MTKVAGRWRLNNDSGFGEKLKRTTGEGDVAALAEQRSKENPSNPLPRYYTFAQDFVVDNTCIFGTKKLGFTSFFYLHGLCSWLLVVTC